MVNRWMQDFINRSERAHLSIPYAELSDRSILDFDVIIAPRVQSVRDCESVTYISPIAKPAVKNPYDLSTPQPLRKHIEFILLEWTSINKGSINECNKRSLGRSFFTKRAVWYSPKMEKMKFHHKIHPNVIRTTRCTFSENNTRRDAMIFRRIGFDSSIDSVISHSANVRRNLATHSALPDIYRMLPYLSRR